MAWKDMNVEELAKSLGINASEVREKQKLIQLIVKIRKEQRISQTALAKKAGVTQSRIAQIESGVGTSKVTFDILLNILTILGYDFKILPKKAA
jgi:transcriptional regulator with XRE-family HTH domain